jgi:putative transposase
VAHRLHLRQLFTALQQHCLVINEEKCVRGMGTLDFLGHRVLSAGMEPLPSHVAGVLCPRPETVKNLQAFLGVVNFFRRFLPAVARTLRPLTDTLRGGPQGNASVDWTPE